MSKLYTVVYRIGGTHRFQWRKTASATAEECKTVRASLTAGGYFSYPPELASRVESIGLPETYQAGDNTDDFEFRNGWIYRKEGAVAA